MPLPNSYTQKPNTIPDYFNAILEAQAPERFSIKFLENMGFTSTNDRLFMSILKELGFLNSDGTPQQRYFDFLDRSRSKQILADAIRDAYSDLFAVNKNAQELSEDDVKNKLRTLYAGKKTDQVIGRIAKTFSALCEYADFSKPAQGKGRQARQCTHPSITTPMVTSKRQPRKFACRPARSRRIPPWSWVPSSITLTSFYPKAVIKPCTMPFSAAPGSRRSGDPDAHRPVRDGVSHADVGAGADRFLA